jgi:hypothetical protein
LPSHRAVSAASANCDSASVRVGASSSSRPCQRSAAVFALAGFSEAGDELGEASYSVWIKPGEIVHVGAGERLRVLDVLPIEEEDLPFVGLLRVERA